MLRQRRVDGSDANETTAVVCGIVGLITCGIFSFVAIVLGKPGGIGRTLGIVGVCLWIIGALLWLILASSTRYRY